MKAILLASIMMVRLYFGASAVKSTNSEGDAINGKWLNQCLDPRAINGQQ